MGMIEFTVTPDHLKLARRMEVSWEDGAFGAPAIDCKRPYGNGDVLQDMREILAGASQDADGNPIEPTAIEETRLRQLHKDMETVLQIGLQTGQFAVGRYTADKYRQDWVYAGPPV